MRKGSCGLKQSDWPFAGCRGGKAPLFPNRFLLSVPLTSWHRSRCLRLAFPYHLLLTLHARIVRLCAPSRMVLSGWASGEMSGAALASDPGRPMVGLADVVADGMHACCTHGSGVRLRALHGLARHDHVTSLISRHASVSALPMPGLFRGYLVHSQLPKRWSLRPNGDGSAAGERRWGSVLC